MRFNYTVIHVPGKSLCTADALSRSPVNTGSHSDSKFQQETDAYVNLLIQNLPVTDKRLTESARPSQKLKKYCQDGWPDRSYHANHI